MSLDDLLRAGSEVLRLTLGGGVMGEPRRFQGDSCALDLLVPATAASRFVLILSRPQSLSGRAPFLIRALRFLYVAGSSHAASPPAVADPASGGATNTGAKPPATTRNSLRQR